MPEGSETPGGGAGPDPPGGGMGAEGRGRRGEGDLLAERRARRAAESGDQALARRAEAAEATVRTLEAHVASLQQRLHEADQERARLSRPIQAGGGPPGPGGGESQVSAAGSQPAGETAVEHELRRARQREYAEQRQRLEAEERLSVLERDSSAELDRLRRRLGDSEGEAAMLAARLEQLRRELAEAEQDLAAERAALRRAEADLQERVAELERRADEDRRELASERAARERAERALVVTRAGHQRLEALVVELKASVERLRAAAEPAVHMATPPARARDAAAPLRRGPGGEPQELAGRGASVRNGEMVEALAAAVERLRARVADAPPALAPAQASASFAPPQHKHSMSLIRRLRLARKQRRQR